MEFTLSRLGFDESSTCIIPCATLGDISALLSLPFLMWARKKFLLTLRFKCSKIYTHMAITSSILCIHHSQLHCWVAAIILNQVQWWWTPGLLHCKNLPPELLQYLVYFLVFPATMQPMFLIISCSYMITVINKEQFVGTPCQKNCCQNVVSMIRTPQTFYSWSYS